MNSLGGFVPWLAAYGVLASPPARAFLEASPAGHMLVQIPALVALGWIGAGALPAELRHRIDRFNAAGVTGLLLALFTLTVWSLPRLLDAALNDPLAELAKFLTLPLLGGLALALSWSRLPALLRGVVWANLVSMLLVMGWLYMEAPLKLCNSYLSREQHDFGVLLLYLAGALMALLAARAVVGPADLRDVAHNLVRAGRG
jgi:hypothetical protein